jgi:hypothetical protein
MKMKKSLMVISGLMASVSAFAGSTIEHQDCTIYLPINATLTSWGEYQQDFIDKGYRPIEFNSADLSMIKPGVLVGGLKYNLRGNSSFGAKNTCTVMTSIKEVIDDRLTMTTLFTAERKQTTRTISEAKISCKKAEKKLQRSIPQCKIK